MSLSKQFLITQKPSLAQKYKFEQTSATCTQLTSINLYWTKPLQRAVGAIIIAPWGFDI